MTENKTTMAVNEILDYKKMAIELLNNREEGRYYVLNYLYEGYDEPMPLLKPLTNAQFEDLKRVVAECEEQGGLSIYEYYDDREVPECLTIDGDKNQDGLPDNAELDTVYRKCDLKVALFYDGLSAAPEVIDAAIFPTEEQYVALLKWQMTHRYASFNDLAYYDPELFKVVNEGVRSFFGEAWITAIASPAFTVELTGLKEDALTLCGEPPVEGELSFSSEGVLVSHSWMSIRDKKMNFFYEKWDADKCLELFELDNLDAIEVEKALGVDSYAGIVEVLKANYASSEGIKQLAALLDEKGVTYTKKVR